MRSVANGAVLHDAWLQVAEVQRTELEFARVVHVVVNGLGTVAWVQKDSYERHGGGVPPATVYDVFALGLDGFRSLRTGLTSEPKSLKLSGNTLAWVEGEVLQGAPMS